MATFDNEYWPADYLVDGTGPISYHHFGEGDYAQTELAIRGASKKNGATSLSPEVGRVAGDGVEAPPGTDLESPETYVGYRRAEQFASQERAAPDTERTYRIPANLSLNQWALGGTWTIGAESAALASAPGSIAFRFHSRDIHVALGPGNDGKPVRYRIELDGAAPGADCGVDCAKD